MTRQTSLLAGLVVVAVLAAWWFLLMAPRNERVAQLADEAVTTRSQQQVVQNRIRALEAVRTEAPDIEAELAAARQLLPTRASLPAALRQLQDAADHSGIVLTNIAPTRPSPVAEVPGLSAIRVSLTVNGSFFQWVDFLRRVEDPRLVGRGVLVDAVDLGVAEYPELTGAVQLTMFQLGESSSPGTGAAPAAAAGDAAEDTAGENTAGEDEETTG